MAIGDWRLAIVMASFFGETVDKKLKNRGGGVGGILIYLFLS